MSQYTKSQGYHLRLKVLDIEEAQVKESLKPLGSISNVVKNNGYYAIDASADVSEEVSRAVCHARGWSLS